MDDLLFKIIGWALRRFADFETHDFLNLLQIGQGYTVTELIVEPGDWLAGQRLDELRLTEAGVNILGIHRGDGGFVGTPTGDTYIRKNDKLILYGARTRIMELDRTKGDDEAGERHKQAVEASRRKWRERADERADGYDVSEMVIRKKSWMVGRRLDELRLPDVGINILGIKRENGRLYRHARGQQHCPPGRQAGRLRLAQGPRVDGCQPGRGGRRGRTMPSAPCCAATNVTSARLPPKGRPKKEQPHERGPARGTAGLSARYGRHGLPRPRADSGRARVYPLSRENRPALSLFHEQTPRTTRPTTPQNFAAWVSPPRPKTS